MSNEILKRAFIEAYERKFSNIPSDEEIAKTHTFSNKFESRMRKLQKKSKIKYVYIFNIQFRRAAVMAVCVLIMFTASLSIEAVRTPIFNFCVSVYEKFSSVFFVSDEGGELSAPTTLEVLYSPDNIPDDYILIEEITDIVSRILIYANADGDEVEFQQNILSIRMIIDTEGVTTEEILINANEGIFFSNKGINNILWYDNQYSYIVKGSIDKNSLLRIAESIKAEK